MTDAEILDLARQHGDEDVCRAGGEEICRAFIFNAGPDDQWSVLTFARALLAEQRESIAREWDGCMAPMFDPAGNPTDPLDIGATIRAASGVAVGQGGNDGR